MYIVILIIAIIIVACTIGNTASDSKAKKNPPNNKTEFQKRRERKYKRYNRLLRHRRIWAVLRFMKEFEELKASKNFYELDKAINRFNQAQERLYEEDYTPAQEDIDVAVRFCQHQYAIEKCNYKLSHEEIESIYNWRIFEYDKYEILYQTAERFKSYWDKVLRNYKRQSDKGKRDEYLIKHLNDMKQKDNFSYIPKARDLFDDLIEYYS